MGAPAAASAARKRRRDAIVIGGGLAGLSAARELERQGLSVAVLEARGRVGGRTLNRKLGGGKVVEIGGQWVGPTQDYVLALIDELGLQTFDTYIEGENIYYRDGTRTTYTGTIPPAAVPSLVEVAVTLQKLNDLAATVPPEAPWDSPNAAEFDSQTFETWKLDNMQTQEARDLLDLAIASIFAAEPRDLSLLYVLFYISCAAHDINHLIDTTGGAQESRVVGGSQQISIKMAKQLGKAVRLSSPVQTIRMKGKEAEVRSGKETWLAKRIVNTLPPALNPTIRSLPALPPGRMQLEQRVPMGTVIKCLAVYDRPFWRDAGLSGMATSNVGPAKLTYDNSPPDGSPGVLLGFIEGQEARDWLLRSPEKRKAAVIGSFERYFGPKARTELTGYMEKSWASDRWSRGCYVGFMGPGVLTGYRGVIRAPIGAMHFAGTETATSWAGYMDGAVQSGLRAAAEVKSAI